MKEASELVVVPDNQDLAGVEDRAVRSTDDADQHGKNKEANGFASKEEYRKQRQDDGERRVDGAHERLQDTEVHDRLERFPGTPSQVFTDAVEDHDRIVHR